MAAESAELDRTREEGVAAGLERIQHQTRLSVNAIGAAETKAAKRIEATAEKLSRKSRRHELKLARQESSKRVEAALERLEERAVWSATDLEHSARAQRVVLDTAAGALREQLEAAMTRLAAGMARVEGALTEIGKSERRMIEVHGRIGDAEARIVEATRVAQAATDLEGRLRSAAEIEDEAARRIREAEERLRDDLER